MWNLAYSVKMSDLVHTASLFNEAVLTRNYSLCVLSGFRRLINDICALSDVQQHRLMVADCLTLEDGTDNLSRNEGN
jgi:tRNA(Met) C34 N-acetyltransferase TmcA